MDIETGHEAMMEVNFGELAEASDALLIGFPDLARYGFQIHEDEDGLVWVTLAKLGVTMLAEIPERDKVARCVLAPMEPQILTGPCVEAIDVYCRQQPNRRWVCDDGWPGVKVIEGPLRTGASKLMVAVEPGARAVICGTRVPWRIVKQTPEVAARAAVSAVYMSELSRKRAEREDGPGYVVTEHMERVRSVRLHDKCSHSEEHWQRMACGHCWCRMCNGWVHPGTKVALKGPTDLVKCNRQWHQLDWYAYLFRENCVGSARLSTAFRKAVGAKRVAPPEDLKDGQQYNLLND